MEHEDCLGTMDPINRKPIEALESSVAERIASGQVVESPYSVVKELVENGIDAGSTLIKVSLEDGGHGLIEVTDNGQGIPHEQVPMAFRRFATSKLTAWDDVMNLETLGFRGEALPSIAAVARVEVFTTCADAEEGSHYAVSGGTVEAHDYAPPVLGTRFRVQDLFFNTPARRKFLKSATADANQVADLVARLALLYPKVGFEFYNNGKLRYRYPVEMDLRHRVAQYLRQSPENLIEVDYAIEGGKHKVYGFLGNPTATWHNRSNQVWSVNGRLVESSPLQMALQQGYGVLCPPKRFPMGYLSLTIEPEAVDVNVHPTKKEVKFAEPDVPFRLVRKGVSKALDQDEIEPKARAIRGEQSKPSPMHKQPRSFQSSSRLKGSDVMAFYQADERSEPHKEQSKESAPRVVLSDQDFREAMQYQPPLRSPEKLFEEKPVVQVHVKEKLPLETKLSVVAQEPVSIQILGQVYRSYIVATINEELWLVDQHAAHERINYNTREGMQPLDGDLQQLLQPEVIQVPPTWVEAWDSWQQELSEEGFICEPFGREYLRLTAIPMSLTLTQARLIMIESLELVMEEQSLKGSELRHRVQEKVRAMAACKASIRANETLSEAEMRGLIEQLLEAERATHCPHGRPTRIRLSRSEIERIFHRA